MNTNRRAVVQRRNCSTDTILIYTQSGQLMATRQASTDAAAARILNRYGIASWDVTEVSADKTAV